MPEAKQPDELRQFVSDLQSMWHRAINLRLYSTGQRLDSAIQALGLEIAAGTDGYKKYETAPKRQIVFSATGREFHCAEARPCPDCGSTEREMRTYGGNWDDADFHCSRCGKLIHRAWFAMRDG